MTSNPPPSPRATTPARRNHQTRPKRWLPWLGAVLLVALIVIGFIPRPIPVETTRVTQGRLRATVNEEGKTRIQQRYVVSAPVTGHLRRIPFKAGAEVIAGQTVVAVIDPSYIATPNPDEVADVFEVPLAFLLEPANQQRHFRMLGETRRDFWAIPFGDRFIWGATAAMLLILDRTLRAP